MNDTPLENLYLPYHTLPTIRIGALQQLTGNMQDGLAESGTKQVLTISGANAWYHANHIAEFRTKVIQAGCVTTQDKLAYETGLNQLYQKGLLYQPLPQNYEHLAYGLYCAAQVYVWQGMIVQDRTQDYSTETETQNCYQDQSQEFVKALSARIYKAESLLDESTQHFAWNSAEEELWGQLKTTKTHRDYLYTVNFGFILLLEVRGFPYTIFPRAIDSPLTPEHRVGNGKHLDVFLWAVLQIGYHSMAGSPTVKEGYFKPAPKLPDTLGLLTTNT